jgi:hypothetical protein
MNTTSTLLNLVPMFNAAEGGNTPSLDEGYYRGQPCGALVNKFLRSQRRQNTFVKPKIKKTIRSPKV